MSQINTIFKAKFILEHYGVENQMIKTIEEMAELTKAIVNLLSDRPSNLEEEIADVQVMLLQLRILLNSDLIEQIMEEKLDRTIQKIEAEIEEFTKAFDAEEQMAEEKPAIKAEDPDPIMEMTEEEIEEFTKAFEEGLEGGVTNE